MDFEAWQEIDALHAEGLGCLIVRAADSDNWLVSFSDGEVIHDSPTVRYRRHGQAQGPDLARAIMEAAEVVRGPRL